ncbi:cytochrome c [Paenibacillus albicereus]|uniref:Cytochrome c n=1 Tax=Paenibacillus albicereus TaxID=2726185 RepID=A0A6H2GV40_9BACL|nr:cytochrome c [Paenibacillus albicereus]QJC51036.1 cytochrome c [Paenibacillus albicereus]
MKTAWAAASAALILALLAGCGSSAERGEASLEGPEEAVALYKQSCISCHGTDLKGRMGPASDLHDVGARLSEPEITRQIEQGGASMPAFGERLTADEIRVLSGWLSGLGKSE